MKIEKKELISWFLDFANMDLNIPPERNIKLLRDNQVRLNISLHPDLRDFTLSLSDDEIIELIVEREETILRLQGLLRDFLQSLSDKIEDTRVYQHKTENYKIGVSTSDIHKMKSFHSIKIEAELGINISPKIERDPENKGWRAYWKDDVERARFSLAIVPTKGDEGFLFYFMQALDGVPLTALGRCSDSACSKWFLQVGRRKRNYCSDLCRIKNFNREKRKRIKELGGETYNSELAKGSGRARASYVKKAKKVSPNVKPQKRPRKHLGGK